MSRLPGPLQSARLLAVLVAGGATLGCAPDPRAPGAVALRDLDFNDFACKVQPLTATRCSMTACHGVADHAFRVYSPGKLRLVPGATLNERDAAITRDEVTANLASMRGLAPAGGPLEESPLLRKPLDPIAGGGEHQGGVLFHTTADPDYVTLKNFLQGEKLPAGCALLGMLQ